MGVLKKKSNSRFTEMLSIKSGGEERKACEKDRRAILVVITNERLHSVTSFHNIFRSCSLLYVLYIYTCQREERMYIDTMYCTQHHLTYLIIYSALVCIVPLHACSIYRVRAPAPVHHRQSEILLS